MKKALIYALALALALSLTACGQPSAEPPADPAPSASAPEPVQDITPEPVSNEVKELSGDELLEYFQTVYDICQKFHTSQTLEGLIEEELGFLKDLTESDGCTLPSDYEDQYRAWRPAPDLPSETQGQQTSSPQQVSDQQSEPAAEQTQKPSASTQQSEPQQTQQPSQPSGGAYDPYDGFGSYDAMIDEYCRRYPELSREEIMNRNPDPATGYIDEAVVRADEAEDRLRGG